ncbi:uncharacterized protein LOC141674574 [Apium graveolens]|uniref:uncharacterized protein LOC141674574 n=1 Tax=Apium graveolens TaxID=4045 RepID=UPI003D7A2112
MMMRRNIKPNYIRVVEDMGLPKMMQRVVDKEPFGYSHLAYALLLIFLILFTIVAIIGCVFLYTGQEKLHNSTSKAIRYVVDSTNSTREKPEDVSEYIGAVKKIQVNQIYLTTNVQTDIDQKQEKINSSATTLTEKVVDNSDDIHDIIHSWVKNPIAHKALDDILPCVDNITTQETMIKTKEVTTQLVNMVNKIIDNFSNSNSSRSFKPFYFNQYDLLRPILCNLYHPDFMNQTCAPGDVDLRNAIEMAASVNFSYVPIIFDFPH